MKLFFKIQLVFLVLIFTSCATQRYIEKPNTQASMRRVKENAAITEHYQFSYEGREFVGFPNVFSPNIFPSPAFVSLPVGKGETLLEIGSGTGALAVTAALKGAARVVAVDINGDAVANTAANAQKHGVQNRVETRVSDVYSAIKANEKFDVIFWNIPFCHIEQRNLTLLEQAAFDPGHKLLERYLAEGGAHLTKSGRLYLGYSTTHGNINVFNKLAAKYSWKTSLIKKTGTPETITLELYELQKYAD